MNWDDCYKQGWDDDGIKLYGILEEVSQGFGELWKTWRFWGRVGGTTNKQTSKNDKLGERKCPLDNASKTQF